MAGESPELVALARRMVVFDDGALAALANRGLVRRAHKDLEKTPPQCTASSDEQFVFEIDGFHVRLGDNPVDARCDCGASAVCRHVLATVIHLRDHVASCDSGPSTQAKADPGAEIMSVTAEALESWAGRAVVRRALNCAREDVDFEKGEALVAQLPALNATVRWLPGAGLGGMLCSCHAAGSCEHKVAAVLAFWASQGREYSGVPEQHLQAAAGAPRTRAEIRDSVRQVLQEMVALGLERISESTRQRLKTLAVSAHGVDLPRLERLLNTLAEETALLLKRNAQGAAAQVFHNAARAWALTAALERPTSALVGVHRTKYERVAGDLDLIGVGARQWRTRSGYEGLTVYFWEPRSRRWNTWTDARPLGLSFEPAARYTQPFPWTGVEDPHEASRSHYRVTGAYRNPVGRLSGRPSTRAVRLGPSNIGRVPAIQTWPDLLPRLERVYGGGLAEPSEQDAIVLLAPKSTRDPVFDEVGQVLRRSLMDAKGRELSLTLPHDDTTAAGANLLESIANDEIVLVLGLVRGRTEGIYVEPITFHTKDRSVHITLDGATLLRAANSHGSTPNDQETDGADEIDRDDLAAPCSPVGLLLQQALEYVEDVAEAGLHIPRDLNVLRALAEKMNTLGLETCRQAALSTADAIDQSRRGRRAAVPAGALLSAGYVLRLALQQEALALWARQLA